MFAATHEILKTILAADGPVVAVTISGNSLSISLRSVVSLSNYKVIAALGRQPGCSFDARAKKATISLIDKNLFKEDVLGFGDGTFEEVMFYGGARFYKKNWDDIAVVLSIENGDAFVALVRRVGGGRAKTFGTAKDAFAAKKPRSASAPWPGKCRGRDCSRFICDAPFHRAMGGLCGYCAFDEYDM